jgi:hypothetical protein
MFVERAAEAEIVTAVAVYTWDGALEIFSFDLALNGEVAVGRGAPFEVFKVVDIGSGEQFVISG